MKETKFRKKELLPAAFIQQNLTKMENLLKEGADLSEIRPEHMAKIIKHEEYIMKILNIEEIRKKNSTTTLEMFIASDTEKISSFLSFINKYFYEVSFSNNPPVWTRRVRPGFEKFVSKDEELFYLQRLENLDGRSITQYVVSGGDDMMVLREQLLDLMVKIDQKIYHEKIEKDASQDRVIANIKRDIPSSRNLSSCLGSVQTRYRWGTFTKIGNIIKSFLSNIALGYTLYVLDIGTDLDFSLEMHRTKSTDLCVKNYQKIINQTFTYGATDKEGSMDCLDDSVYLQQGIIGFAHVIIPQTVSLLAGFCCVPWVSLPLPLITKGYRFYLDVRNALFKASKEPTEDEQDEKLMETDEKRQEFQRRKKKFRKKMEDNKEVEEKLKVNNRDILMAQQVECTGESSFQFFMQTLWLMPTLMVLWWDKVSSAETANLDDLFNLRTFSVAMSFVTMGMSYTSIRSGTIKGR